MTTWVDARRGSAVVDVPLRLYERDQEIAGSVVGAALGMRLFTFFVPLVLTLVGLVGFAHGYLQEDRLDDVGVTGQLADQVQAALEQPSQTRWIALLSGLVGMLTTGRVLSRAMMQASCLAWRIPVRARASARILGAFIGTLVGIALTSMGVNVAFDRTGIGLAGVSYLGAVAMYVVVWTVVLAQLPRAASAARASLLPGAVAVAAAIVGLQAVSQLYLPRLFHRASALYGAIGSAVVVLGWFFLVGRVVILSIQLNAVVHEHSDRWPEAVLRLPALRLLAGRRWVRWLVEGEG